MKMFILAFILLGNSFASEELALKKIKQFEKELKKELKKGLKKSPIDAVEICNLKAPGIQNKVSTEKIKIGRVSLKNRNPGNKPKAWMKSYINQFHDKKIKKPFVVVDLENGKKGLLKPIKTMPLCLNCHGANVDEKLYEVISKKYPEDKATGYKLGDIRGFFWVEY